VERGAGPESLRMQVSQMGFRGKDAVGGLGTSSPEAVAKCEISVLPFSCRKFRIEWVWEQSLDSSLYFANTQFKKNSETHWYASAWVVPIRKCT